MQLFLLPFLTFDRLLLLVALARLTLWQLILRRVTGRARRLALAALRVASMCSFTARMIDDNVTVA